MKISVIGLGVYSLAISKMLAKKDENEIVIWTENNEKYEEYKKTKKVASVFDTKLPKYCNYRKTHNSLFYAELRSYLHHNNSYIFPLNHMTFDIVDRGSFGEHLAR